MILKDGPFHNRIHEDVGTVQQKFSAYCGNAVGTVIYEPTADRSESIYKETVWNGDTLAETPTS